MAHSDDVVTLISVGDVAPSQEDSDAMFDYSRDLLRGGDITFGQLERALSSRGHGQLNRDGMKGTGRWESAPVDTNECAQILARAGFDVMSFAGNHSLDWSEESMFDTIEGCRKANVQLAGAGADLHEAREPVIIERKGTKVGYLAYSSVIPKGHEATESRSGMAPFRAHTYYEQIDWQPGTPPRIVSEVYAEDLAGMVADIKALRPKVDVLVVSHHWGVHGIPAVIAMYQHQGAYAAIDAGADLILGHHAHIMKGVEIYKGKAIFYSLNNFALGVNGPHHQRIKEDTPPQDNQKTLMVKATIVNKQIERLSIIPIWLDWKVQPKPLPAADPQSDSVFEYLQWVCEHEKLETKFVRDGDEIVVLT